ncbi:MAG: hypothetical protein ABEJ02_01065 [Candidatus Paceibacteria bacterium]
MSCDNQYQWVRELFFVSKQGVEIARKRSEKIKVKLRGIELIIYPETDWKDAVRIFFIKGVLDKDLGTEYIMLLSNLFSKHN